MTPETLDPGGPGIVLNLAGEGEVDNAIDINSLIFPLRPPERWARSGRFIQADITALPVRSAVAVEVVGRKLPMMSGGDRLAVAREAVRVPSPEACFAFTPAASAGRSGSRSSKPSAWAPVPLRASTQWG